MACLDAFGEVDVRVDAVEAALSRPGAGQQAPCLDEAVGVLDDAQALDVGLFRLLEILLEPT